jgi:hypothetical protein
MINQLEIPMYLEDALPEICADLKARKKDSAYNLMNILSAFTNKNIESRNYNVVKRCFLVADKLYSRGDTKVKNAVENVFVYAFSRLLCLNKNEKCVILGLIPGSLYTLYVHQVLKTGI